MESAILSYLGRCPGPYFRQLAKELSAPVGTLSHHLYKLIREGLVYKLGSRPRYFPSEIEEERGWAIYLLREGPRALAEAQPLICGRRLCPHVRDLLLHSIEAYPCLRRDIVDNFIVLMSML